ncbi:MAG: hypothetical protein KatS3mg111_2312 [Pirellulaceae bacterium]|nr:MAG: hypothetical protein KatS3mg111_2312 [Pirellulaceae bacterium]
MKKPVGHAGTDGLFYWGFRRFDVGPEPKATELRVTNRYTNSFLLPIKVRNRSASKRASNGFLNVSLIAERSKLNV